MSIRLFYNYFIRILAISPSCLKLTTVVANLKGYNINNNNYFKLRDLGSALGIRIDWDSTTKTVVVDSTGGNGGSGGSGGSGEVGETGNVGGTGSSGSTGSTGSSGSSGENGGTGSSGSTGNTGTYELSPEMEADLQKTLDRIRGRDDAFAERVEAGWRTTLSPEDPRHPGWEKDGVFQVATLRPGEKQPSNAKGYGAYFAYGTWDGITVN